VTTSKIAGVAIATPTNQRAVPRSGRPSSSICERHCTYRGGRGTNAEAVRRQLARDTDDDQQSLAEGRIERSMPTGSYAAMERVVSFQDECVAPSPAR
jgi:hypothetical protein